LAEDHAEHLVPTGKALDISIAVMGLDDTVEDPAGKELGYLGEDIFTLVHGFFVKIHIPVQIVTPSKSTADTIYKEFQRT